MRNNTSMLNNFSQLYTFNNAAIILVVGVVVLLLGAALRGIA
jgi:hypothetical protein